MRDCRKTLFDTPTPEAVGVNQLENAWTYVASLDEIPKGKKRSFAVGKDSVIVCRVYDEVYIVKNLCPHMNQPLAEGRMQEYELTCPHHDACFDVRDGKPVAGPSVWPVKTYQCRVVEGSIYMHPTDKTESQTPRDPRLGSTP